MKILPQKIFITEQIEEDGDSICTIVINPNNTETIFRNSQEELHRVGGPAYTNEFTNNHPIKGKKNIFYIQNGVWHRTDGPAVSYGSGQLEYAIYGKRYYSKEDYDEAVRILKKNEADYELVAI